MKTSSAQDRRYKTRKHGSEIFELNADFEKEFYVFVLLLSHERHQLILITSKPPKE